MNLQRFVFFVKLATSAIVIPWLYYSLDSQGTRNESRKRKRSENGHKLIYRRKKRDVFTSVGSRAGNYINDAFQLS